MNRTAAILALMELVDSDILDKLKEVIDIEGAIEIIGQLIQGGLDPSDVTAEDIAKAEARMKRPDDYDWNY